MSPSSFLAFTSAPKASANRVAARFGASSACRASATSGGTRRSWRSISPLDQFAPDAIISGVVPSRIGRNGSAPLSARMRMISTSAYFAASRNGVAPTSDPGSIHQWVARGTRLPLVRRTSGSAP